LGSTSVLTVGTLAGSNGAYTLSGGYLQTGDLIVGGHDANNPTPGGTGVFTVSGTGVLYTDHLIVLNTSGSSLNLRRCFEIQISLLSRPIAAC
jgi:hypothetical protein